MASKVDICNIALSHIGQRAIIQNISPPDASVEAQICARYYPQARDELLEERRWGFCATRAPLALLTATPPAAWAYVYKIPDAALELIAVLQQSTPDDNITEPYIVEGTTILSNTPNATLRYTFFNDDPTTYPAFARSALGWLISHYLAGSIIKGDTGAKVAEGAYKMYQVQLAKASAFDANQAKTTTYANHKPEFLGSRETSTLNDFLRNSLGR